MARWKNRPTDPFNADDPIMPWDAEPEYVPIDAARPSTSAQAPKDDHDCWVDDDEPEASREAERPSRRGRTSKHRTSTAKPARSTATSSGAQTSFWARATAGKTARDWPTPPPATTKLKQVDKSADSVFDDDTDLSVAEPGSFDREAAAAAALVASKRAARKRSPLKWIVIFIVALSLASSLIGVVVGCVSTIVSSTTELFDSDDDYISYEYDSSNSSDSGLEWETYDAVKQELKAQELTQAEAVFADMVACDEALLSAATGYVNNYFSEWSTVGYYGLTLADFGIDAESLARWTLEGVSYDANEIYAYVSSENDADTSYEGNLSVTLTHPDVEELLWDIDEYLCKELDYNVSGLTASSISDELKAGVQQELTALQAELEQAQTYFYFDFTGSCEADGSNPVASIDAASFESAFAKIFGLYLD